MIILENLVRGRWRVGEREMSESDRERVDKVNERVQ